MFNNIGEKIKSFAKAAFFVEVIAAIISAIVLYIEYEEFWCILIALGGIPTVWILSMLVYGFGEIIVKLTEIKNQTGTLSAEIKRRSIQEKVAAEQEALRKVRQTQKEQEAVKPKEVKQDQPLQQEVETESETAEAEQPLAEKLSYALKFSTDHGMVKYLKTLDDERVRSILRAPESEVRELIRNLLNTL